MLRWVLIVGVCLLPAQVLATVYYSKDEAFELAFGKDAVVESIPVFLTDEQVGKIEKTARVKVDSKLVTFYEGKHGDRTLGYAAIESHVVRSQQETLLIVLSPSGELTRIEVLAFHEPPEYQSPVRWLQRLYRRTVADLVLNQGIDGIAGATLSSRAVLDGTRKVMAIYQLALKEERG
jgi:Na+-translocating ferredoxin:NAD+ oxidoreductase RnfG subunit